MVMHIQGSMSISISIKVVLPTEKFKQATKSIEKETVGTIHQTN